MGMTIIIEEQAITFPATMKATNENFLIKKD